MSRFLNNIKWQHYVCAIDLEQCIRNLISPDLSLRENAEYLIEQIPDHLAPDVITLLITILRQSDVDNTDNVLSSLIFFGSPYYEGECERMLAGYAPDIAQLDQAYCAYAEGLPLYFQFIHDCDLYQTANEAIHVCGIPYFLDLPALTPGAHTMLRMSLDEQKYNDYVRLFDRLRTLRRPLELAPMIDYWLRQTDKVPFELLYAYIDFVLVRAFEIDEEPPDLPDTEITDFQRRTLHKAVELHSIWGLPEKIDVDERVTIGPVGYARRIERRICDLGLANSPETLLQFLDGQS